MPVSETTVTQPVFLSDVHPRSRFMQAWESRKKSRRVSWLIECIAEAFGTFLYTYAGTGSTAGYILGNLAKLEGLSNLFQIGVAYAVGIVMALSLCVSTSGGHINPAVTITATIFGQCTPGKAARLIISQIFGAYVACMLVYVQYRDLIIEVEDSLKKAGTFDTILFTPQGPAGIFGLYSLPGLALGHIFLNEFVCDFVLGVTIFGSLDPTNFHIGPQAGVWLTAFAYAFVIWSFSPAAIASNTARDVGGRLAAMTIYGTKAAGGSYSAIAALTSIPATFCAFVFYEFFLKDTSRGDSLSF
ncbi:aquaporin-like protein [Abortiporus biennis]|nr:aquaporin-like protein [Abortiporus biennis]